MHEMDVVAVTWAGRPLSRLGLGSAAFGGPGWSGSWGEQSDDQSIATIRAAVDSGINWVDTAPVYGHGHAEEVIGRALASFSSAERPLVFSKCGLRWDAANPAAGPVRFANGPSIRAELLASLRRLGVEALDLYQVHWPPAAGGTLEEVWEAMLELREEGLTRAVGVCNYSVPELGRSWGVRPGDSVQLHLSVAHQERAGDVVQWCHQRKVNVLAFGVLRHGLLSGAGGLDGSGLPPADWRRRLDDFAGPGAGPRIKLVRRLQEIAADHHVDAQQVAIAWALAVPGVTAAIIGARNPGHVGGWLGATDVSLAEALATELAGLVPRVDGGA